MSDTYTKVTRQSWGSRLGGAFKGIILGLILAAFAFWILFTNEGRAVRRHKALVEGGAAVVSVDGTRVDPANEGKLIHLTGLADTDDVLRDVEFGVSARALHLERSVEMYQWRESRESETKKKLGGGTETTTTYSYSKGWESRPIDSSSFERPEGHANPPMPYRDRRVSAESVRLGGFRLSPGLVNRITNAQPLAVESLDSLPSSLRSRARLTSSGVYIGDDTAAPQLGDLRVSFRQVPPQTVSIVSAQRGDGLAPYQARTGSVELLTSGSATAEAMFESAKQANRFLTWLLRLGGFLLMWLGFRIVLKPLSVLADVLPVLGNIAEKVSGLFAGLAAAFLSLLTIAVAWLFYRPLIGILVLALALAAGYWMVKVLGRSRRQVAATPPPPPPPPPAPA